jgi:hypothetical protein
MLGKGTEHQTNRDFENEVKTVSSLHSIAQILDESFLTRVWIMRQTAASLTSLASCLKLPTSFSVADALSNVCELPVLGRSLLRAGVVSANAER